ncbi:MAG TPA: GNAT family N-acetyltransferase [Thermoleophilia bacterium]
MSDDELSEKPIRAPRLDLVLLSRPLMDEIIAGDRRGAQALARFALAEELFSGSPDDVAYFSMRRDQVLRDPSWAPWSQRAIVLRHENVMIGTATFHGPPGVNDTSTPGAAEVGYEIFPAYRSRGFATEAGRTLIDWACREHGVTHSISGVEPRNLPSLRVNEKLGLVPTGRIVDGELIFELHLTPACGHRSRVET